MGYRLNIKTFDGNKTPNKSETYSYDFYGTKLFGYVDTQKLRSFKYLEQLDKVNEYTIFDYGFDNLIKLSSIEFSKFFALYLLDIADYYAYGCDPFTKTELQDLSKIINSENFKYIWWD